MNNQISEQILLITSKIHEVNRVIRKYGTDTEMHDAEIHLIREIGKSDKAYNRDLAKTMNITCGAVSQTLEKLTKKGMIYKEKDEKNLSRFLIYLTPKGKIAFECHEELHSQFQEIVSNCLGDMDKTTLTKMSEFLDKLEQQIYTMKKL